MGRFGELIVESRMSPKLVESYKEEYETGSISWEALLEKCNDEISQIMQIDSLWERFKTVQFPGEASSHDEQMIQLAAKHHGDYPVNEMALHNGEACRESIRDRIFVENLESQFSDHKTLMDQLGRVSSELAVMVDTGKEDGFINISKGEDLPNNWSKIISQFIRDRQSQEASLETHLYELPDKKGILGTSYDTTTHRADFHVFTVEKLMNLSRAANRIGRDPAQVYKDALSGPIEDNEAHISLKQNTEKLLNKGKLEEFVDLTNRYMFSNVPRNIIDGLKGEHTPELFSHNAPLIPVGSLLLASVIAISCYHNVENINKILGMGYFKSHTQG